VRNAILLYINEISNLVKRLPFSRVLEIIKESLEKEFKIRALSKLNPSETYLENTWSLILKYENGSIESILRKDEATLRKLLIADISQVGA
jgi:hypothetical protein